MMTAVLAARSRLGISMMPRALYENRQARTSRSASVVVDQQRRLEPPHLAHRLDELGIVGQQRRRIDKPSQLVFVDAVCGLCGAGGCRVQRQLQPDGHEQNLKDPRMRSGRHRSFPGGQGCKWARCQTM